MYMGNGDLYNHAIAVFKTVEIVMNSWRSSIYFDVGHERADA